MRTNYSENIDCHRANMPAAVHVGDMVGIIAPASPIKNEFLCQGELYLQNMGFKTMTAKNIFHRMHHVAGSVQDRLDDMYQMFTHDEVKAVFAARGGYGSVHLLDQLDYALLAEYPKLLVGYSDITALQLALWSKIRLSSLSGPMVATEMARPDTINDLLLRSILAGTLPEANKLASAYLQDDNVRFLRAKNVVVRGRLLGGTLSVLSALAGTPYFPDLTGAVPILEERGERIYQLDRYLSHLRLAGVFEQVAMVVVGALMLPDPRENYLLPGFINNFFAADSFPLISGFCYGHCPRSFIFPQGIGVEFNLTERSISFLSHWVL